MIHVLAMTKEVSHKELRNTAINPFNLMIILSLIPLVVLKKLTLSCP